MADDPGQILRAIDGLRRDVKDLHAQQGRVVDQLAQINGTVGRHDRWIAIRDDRERQADERGESRSAWFKVAVVAAVTVAVAVLSMVATIFAQGVH